MFPNPLPAYLIVAFTAAGAITFWARWGRDRMSVFGLRNVLELFPMKAIARARFEFFIFVVLSYFIGIGIVDPKNATQSFSAGFAWVGLFTKMESPDKLGAQRKKK